MFDKAWNASSNCNCSVSGNPSDEQLTLSSNITLKLKGRIFNLTQGSFFLFCLAIYQLAYDNI